VSQSGVRLTMLEPLRPALAVSALVHAGVLALAMLLTARAAHPSSTLDVAGASVSGETFDVDELLQGQKHESPAEPAAPAAPAAVATQPGDEVPVAPPRPRRPAKKKPAPSPLPAEPNASTGSAPSAAASASSGGSGAESGGTSGEAPGVASLAKAFAKAVAAAAHKDSTWDELPLGPAGSVRVVVHVDDEGRIERSLISDKDRVPAHLVKLVDRTLLLLRAGRFALTRSEAKAGSESLRVEVTLSSVEPQEDYEDPKHTVAMGFEPPRSERAGRAYFVHAAGRRFDAKISLE